MVGLACQCFGPGPRRPPATAPTVPSRPPTPPSRPPTGSETGLPEPPAGGVAVVLLGLGVGAGVWTVPGSVTGRVRGSGLTGAPLGAASGGFVCDTGGWTGASSNRG